MGLSKRLRTLVSGHAQHYALCMAAGILVLLVVTVLVS